MNLEELEILMKSFDYVAGVDEVGRGCLAGPMFVCSVVVSPFVAVDGAKDSKLLSQAERERLLPKIIKSVSSVGIGVVSNKDIDRFGMSISLRLAILKSLSNLEFIPKLVITDYVDIKSVEFERFLRDSDIPKKERYLEIYDKMRMLDIGSLFQDGVIWYVPVKKADRYVQANSMASIIAKVLRDRYMVHISKHYPGYGFDRNKGYGTREHILAIKRLGCSSLHRKSFLRFVWS